MKHEMNCELQHKSYPLRYNNAYITGSSKIF